jgi:thioredoxin 1
MDMLDQHVFTPVEGAVRYAVTWIMRHPAMIMVLIWWAFKRHRAKQPLPDYGGDVTTVEGREDWQKLQDKTKSEGSIICLDAFATWCPPCKAAAPVFAAMSTQFGKCCFAKVNVDDAKDLAKDLGITSMPTFKIFKGRQEVATAQGWNEAGMRAALLEHGAVLCDKKQQ